MLIRIEHDSIVGGVTKSYGQPQTQLTATSLVQDTASQASFQDVEFGLGERALHAEDQAIVEVGRIIEAVLIEQQRVGQRTELQELVPIAGVASEAGHLETEDYAGMTEADLSHKAAEPLAVGGRSRAPEVIVYDDHLVLGPAEGCGAIAQRVLPPRALCVFGDLLERRLADIEVGRSAQMLRRHLVG